MLLSAVVPTGCQPPAGSRADGAVAKASGVTQASFGGSALSRAEAELSIRLSTGKGMLPDADGAFGALEHLAEEGFASAQFSMGEAYVQGTWVVRNPRTAAAWLQKAADQKYAQAQSELAVLYLNGLGVPKDYGKAMDLAKASAGQGNVEAETVLGQIYLQGLGVAADPDRALAAYKKAAAAKSANAMIALGTLYRDGKGVPADKVVAFAWFDLAMANTKFAATKDQAAKGRDDLALVLLPTEKSMADRLAGAWQPGEDLAAKRAALGSGDGEQAPLGAPANAVFASAAITANSSGKAADIRIVEKQLSEDVEVDPDGGSIRIMHIETQPKTEAVLKDIGQMPLPYAASLETVDVTEAYTLKPDGRKLPVDPAAIYAQLMPGTPNVPMFDDLHQKVVVFPYVEVGDTLVLTAKYTVKPRIPGLFSFSYWFDPTAAQSDVRITIKAPKAMPLQTETHDLRFERREEGDKIAYEWHYANLTPAAESHAAIDLRDRVPRLSVSNFQSYEQFARAYSALAEPKTAVTPKIKALAAEITAHASDRRARAEAIYYWVSRHIRFVGIELGVGGIVPHDAETVLANGYGDCKDHSVLFSALLKASGIASDVILINYGASYSMPKPPSIGTLNHAITYLPELGLYADTTAGVAPFGTLPFGEYGKPVVHTVASTKAVQRTPDLAGGAASISSKTTAHLGADGKVTGETETIGTGPFSILMRQVAIQIQAAGIDQVAKQQLRSAGLDGSGTYDLGQPYEISPNYRIASHFETGARAEYLSGTSFHLPVALSAGVSPGDMLIGPFTLIDPTGIEPTACYNGHETQELSLELPAGRHLRELPKGREISDPHFHFKSEWSLTGQTVTVKRDFSVTVDEPVCIGDVRRAAAKAIIAIQDDYRTQIALVSN